MAQAATGTTWEGAGLNDLTAEDAERTKKSAALCRDARGSATDISPHNPDGSVRWSPIAEDGTWVDDLTLTRLIGGFWVTNPVQPTQGFHNLGAFKEGDGPGQSPDIKADKLRIEQSDFPYLNDMVEQGEMFAFTPIDTAKPAVRRLRNNLPFSSPTGDPIVEDPGTLNAGWGRKLDSENVDRQFLFCREYKKNGKPVLVCDGYDLATLDNIGKSKYGKKDTAASEFSYEPTPSGFFRAMVDGVYTPIIRYTWVGGPGWIGRGGLPVFSATVPTGTPGGSGAVAISIPEPTGTGDPWEYKAQASVDGGTTWGSLIVPDDISVSSGTVTLSLTGIATGATKFRVEAKGTNGATAQSPSTAVVTVT